MGIISVEIKDGSRSGTWTEDERQYTYVYRVLATPDIDLFPIFTASGAFPTPPATAIGSRTIPVWGVGYGQDTFARVRNIDVKEKERKANGDIFWDVTVNFSTKKKDGGTSDAYWQFNWTTNDEQAPVYFDNSSTPKPYASSAGEPFETEKNWYVAKWTGSGRIKVSSTYTLNSVSGLIYTYNSSGVTTDGMSIPAKHGLLKSLQLGDVVYEGSGPYRLLSCVIEFLVNDTWDADQVLDIGYEELDPTTKKRKPILGLDGTRVKRPHPLDGSGHAKTNANDTPATLSFQWPLSGSWSVLGLT